MKRKCALLVAIILIVGMTGCAADFMDPMQIQPGTVGVQKETQAVTTAGPGEGLLGGEQSDENSATEKVLPIILPNVEKLSIGQAEPADNEFVLVQDYLPNVRVELVYATDDNFTKKQIYSFTDAYLRYGTVKKLKRVCESLGKEGLGLKIWDAFRPTSVQQKLWESFPDPIYVADPTKGFSIHSRGSAMDLTLVDSKGRELEMPSDFDSFTAIADRDYSDCSEKAAANAQKLEDVMEICGFEGYADEWWHFSDTDTYAVSETFEPVTISRYYAKCNEYLNLRKLPSTASDVIGRVPANDQFGVLAFDGEFAYADYKGMRGYLHQNYIELVGTTQ